MQFSISISIATLLLSVAILPAAAQAQTTVQLVNLSSQSANPPSPFNLSYLAYRGYLKDWGIPEADALIQAIASGQITAQDIIQAAVKANRLSEQTLSDRGYRHSLEAQLKEWTTD
jgi:short-subunit dehydrogenase